MCGIAGVFRSSPTPSDRAAVSRMSDAIAHRGPDGEGLLVRGGATLGHRRLSIVDLAGGAQPMSTPCGRWAVAFNGEIFNHAVLRPPLERLGARFTTSSDTETLLSAFAHWGETTSSRFNGMFAWAGWDNEQQRGVLVRDRTGQKPLYWTQLSDGGIAFCSELKGLLASGLVERRIDIVAIAQYLTYEYVPWPRSAIAGVHKLPPGHLLRWSDGTVQVERWYDLPFTDAPELPGRSGAEWADEVRDTLARSVERRLMADVPLGVFLSGGIDSTSVVAMMARVRDPSQIDTFSIAFDDPSYDESGWARRAAREIGTRHHEEVFTAERMLEHLPSVLGSMDEPFADASLLPTSLLSAFTRQHVTVALGGDGGDELFLGYETFRADTAARLWRAAPRPLHELAEGVASRLPVRHGNFSFDFVVRSFLRGADAADAFRHIRWLASFLPNTDEDPLRPELRALVPDADVYGVMATPYLECPDPDHLQRLSRAYLHAYLAEDILTKVDRASMASGLEVRSPFLDPEMLSLAARMPSRYKLRYGWTGKWVLREAMRGQIPDWVLDRSKKGFGIPVGAWLNGPLAPLVDSLLSDAALASTGVVRSSVVRRLVDEHRSGRANHRKQIWTLLMLQSWMTRNDVVAG